MLVRFLVLELLFQALSRYSKILVYTCISTIFCSRTVILQLLVVQVVWFLLQFPWLRCIARSAYVDTFVLDRMCYPLYQRLIFRFFLTQAKRSFMLRVPLFSDL